MRLKEWFKLMWQFFKFGIVGISNTAISLGVYYLFVWLGVHYVIANGIGFVLSVINSFFWNSKFIFKDKQEHSTWRAFLKVFASYGMSFLMSTVLITVFVEVLHISEWLAPILRLVLTVPFNFIMNKLWAFKEKFNSDDKDA